MHLKRKIGTCLLAAAVVAGVAPAVPAVAAPAKQSSRQLPRSTPFRSVTLITGDRLDVATDGSNRVAVTPAKGREHVGFVSRTVGGHLQVLPTDAVPLVNSGKVDRRLFDVTTLVQSGYDDRRSDLPLIVTYTGSGRNALRSNAATAGAAVGRDLPAVNGVAIKQKRATAGAFWNSITKPGAKAEARTLRGEVGRVWLDGIRQPTLDVSVPLIGAPVAWQAGFTGQGVPVGVVDTGIDDSHPDLAGKVIAAQNFTDETDTVDRVGHGTHVASTITGSGAASGGRYKGVAPGVKLYSAKVCLLFGCAESWILAGMQWAAGDQHAKVVNMSLGGGDTPDIDPLEQAVQTLTAQYGTLFVIAAGNAGGDYTVGSPGSADDALTVGAVTKKEELADFSSRGPRIGDSAIKPDITAPGVDITAARGKDGVIGNPGDLYATISGTSMATPHVAGSAAILAGEHPDWTPAQLKAALMAAAKPNPAIGVFAQGAGRVDIGRAIHQTVTTSPASVSFGLQQWPHNDDTPIAKTVTYHNSGTAAVTLNLALNTTGPDGKPSAAGLFTLSASTVTVPAGGDASVTVTADTRVNGPDGFAGGELTATGGDQVVQTPVGVVKEVESYDVTLTHVDRTGQPTANYQTILIALDKFNFAVPFDPSGTVKTRLPKGRYLVASIVVDGDPEKPNVTSLVQPLLTVDKAQTVNVDARTGKPSSVSVERPTAKSVLAQIGFTQKLPEFGFGSIVIGDTLDRLFSAQIGGGKKADGFVSFVGSQWGQLQSDGTLTNSPFAYNLQWFEKGRMITGFQRTIRDRDLATVKADMAVEATGVQGEKVAFAQLGDVGGGFSVGFPYDLPASRTELYNTDGGVQWSGLMLQTVLTTIPGIPFPIALPISEVESPPTTYRAGHTVHESWNQGVFGPAFPAPPAPFLWATRSGDNMIIAPPLYSDGAGHAGNSQIDTASITVFKDGTKVGQSQFPGDQFTVPAAAGQYRVEMQTTRGAATGPARNAAPGGPDQSPFRLSTATSVAWTFRSGHVDGDQPQALPLSAIRFTPRLDATNKAPANTLYAIPIEVQRQAGSSAGHNRTLNVQVSFDDGATWQPVLVLRFGDRAVALVQHPKGPGFVSLKAKAGDSDGNTVEETIIRAYEF